MVNIIGVISIALFIALPIAIVTLITGALVSGVAFGGARRNTRSILAVGVFSLLTGGVYLYGMAASYYAKQDNAYLGNFYIGLILLLAGVWLLSVGLACAGMSKWLAGLLALAGVAGIIPIYDALQVESIAGGSGIALYVAGALLATVAALLVIGRGALLTRALGLGLAGMVGAGAVFALAGALTGGSFAAYSQVGVDLSLASKPPVLEGFGMLACAVAGVVVYCAGRRGYSQDARAAREPLAPEPAPAG